jgi:hypothetical protein
MIIIGLILLVVGGAVAYFFPDQIPRFCGAVCCILGLILVVLGVADAGDVNLEDRD